MTRIRWTVWLPLALFAAFAVLVAVQLLNPASREVESAMIGKPLPAFALKAASHFAHFTLDLAACLIVLPAAQLLTLALQILPGLDQPIRSDTGIGL